MYKTRLSCKQANKIIWGYDNYDWILVSLKSESFFKKWKFILKVKVSSKSKNDWCVVGEKIGESLVRG